MLFKSNKHVLLILLLLIAFILIPVSFAEDLNDSYIDTYSVNNDGNSIYVSIDGSDTSGNGSQSNPYASISKAVEVYNSSVNSNIFIKNGTYLFNNEIVLNKSINFTGESATGVILDGNNQNYLFKVSKYSNVSFNSLSFVNGNSTNKVTSYSEYPAGAIYLSYANKVNVNDCIFKDNMQSAISFYGSYSPLTLTVTNSVFIGNKVSAKQNHGGAIYFYGPGVLNIKNTTFENNKAESAYGSGGAIYVAGNAYDGDKLKTTIDNCTFKNNFANTKGGAFGEYCGGNTVITNCIFIGNTANINGSCIYDNQRNSAFLTLSLKNNTYVNNTPDNSLIHVEGNVNIIDLDTNTRLSANNIDMKQGEDENFIVTLTDGAGNPLANKEIIITLTNYYKNVTTFTVTTNNLGQAIVSLKNQNPGRYSVISTFKEDGYDSVNITNKILISSDEYISLIIVPSNVKLTEGESCIIKGYIVDEYWEPLNSLDHSQFYLQWFNYVGNRVSIYPAGTVYNGEFEFDLIRCHLTSRDKPYYVNFTVDGDYQLTGTVTVDMSKIMPPVPKDIDIIYVAKDGSDVTGNGSADNPLASVQMALYVNGILGGGKTIKVSDGMYDISAYSLFYDVTIIGNYNKTIFRQTNGNLGMFMIDRGTTAYLTNITFINGYTTPTPDSLLTINSASVVYIDGCNFINNTCLNGGAIAISGNAVVNINNSVFRDNKAILITSEGGAIWVYEGSLNINNTVFYNNTACDGGAIYVSSGSNVLIENTVFDNNTAYKTTLDYGGGGAIYASYNCFIEIINSTFVKNYAELNGGAIYMNGLVNMNITKSYFENNTVKNDGTGKATSIASDYNKPASVIVNCTIFITNMSSLNQVTIGGYGSECYVNLNTNYWGSNSKGRTSENIENWIIIGANISGEFVEVGVDSIINIEFKGKSSNGTFNLNGNVHDFKVDLSTILSTVNPTSVTIVNNKAETTYIPTIIGHEVINFTDINGKVVYSFAFDVEEYIERINVTLSTENIVMYYLDGSKFLALLKDVNGNPIENAILVFIINGVKYERTTNASGIATLNITLLDGTYDITSVFNGNRYYYKSATNNNTVTVKPIASEIILKVNNITVDQQAIIVAELNVPEGVVLFNVNGTTQYVDVVNGIASIKLDNLSAGVYSVKVNYDKFKGYSASENFTSFTVSKVDNYDFNVTINDVSVSENVNINVVLPNDATDDVVAVINSENYTAKLNNGIATIIVPNLSVGTYNVSVIYKGNEKYTSSIVNKTVNVIKSENINLTVNNLVKYFNGTERLIANVCYANGNPIANATLIFTINGVNYVKVTDDKGSASMAINLGMGNYNVTTKLNETESYTSAIVNSTITVKSTVMGVDIVKMYRNGTQYYVLFLDSEGNPLMNTTVKFNINGVMYERVTNEFGVAKLNINLRAGTYVITNHNLVTGEENSNTIVVKSLLTDNYDLVKYYMNDSQYTLKVFDKTGTIASGVEVTFNINGVFYKRISDKNGLVTLKINLRPGSYIVTAEYEGCTVSNNIVVKTVLETADLSMAYKDGSTFNAKVLDGQGNPVANEMVTFNVNGVFYHKTTDENGVAKLNINLMKGQYIITSYWNDYQVGNKIIIA